MTTSTMITQEQAAIESVKRLANIVLGLRNDVFKEGLDYGKIPGAGDKDVLFLPGMEKFMRALHLRAEYVALSQIEDFDKNLIYYRYECRMIDYETGVCVSTAIGSANSHESKWRYREQKRKCPVCGMEAIIKGKEEYGGGWLCHKKQNGCGAKFADGDKAIEGQKVGRIENPDIFDQMNTIDKIAQKRALASAIKGAANVSEFFTVDMEDFQSYNTRPAAGDFLEGQFTVVEPSKSPAEPSSSVRGAGITQPTKPAEPKQETADMRQRPDETETDPNRYTIDKLIINRVGDTALQYVLAVHKRDTRIFLSDPGLLEDKLFDGAPVLGLEPKTYRLFPMWTVQADHTAAGWDIQNIDASVPETA